ncbi:hypothetical protein VTN02DRAFT_6160 [Thermoascus thermophilus]
MWLRPFSLLLALVPLVAAQSAFIPARPPALPLAVKSPYVNTWLDAGRDGGDGGYLPGQWPVFWTNQVTGWTGMIRVDGEVYTWMGLPGSRLVNQTSYRYTSTRSVFAMDVAGAVAMNITFLSPVTPDDLQRQSLAFSYLHVDVWSMDGKSHDVQLYADISAEWVSGNRSNVAQWDYGVAGDVAYHRVYRQTQQLFSETTDQAEWGSWYWATDSVDGLTHQSGADVDVRGAFARDGRLANTTDGRYRAIQDDWPVFGFAVDLGSVGASAASALFTIGLAQTQAVQFAGAQGYAPLPALWTGYFDNDLAALEFFHRDYATASRLSTQLDDQIARDSTAAAAQDYLTITSLAVRQVFAATQLCGTAPDRAALFLKEISSNGNVNTVDVIFPAHPVFLYTNPALLALLLDPLFENQEAGRYPNRYAMHDLGAHFPNATGHPDGRDERMPLEECAGMVLLALAYARRTRDVAYLTRHYALLEQWTGYLVEEALYPANQISTDDFAGPLANQTNLALKGILAIQAMSVIANLTGHAAAATNYSGLAHDYIGRWQTLGIAHDADPPHATLSYGANDTYGILYNLYADQELDLQLVPRAVYDMQSAFYPTVENRYGVPLDTRHSYTKGDWELFAAAIAAPTTQRMFHRALATWLNETPTNRPLTDLYDTVTGDYPGIYFVARPVLGAAFALLALGLQMDA